MIIFSCIYFPKNDNVILIYGRLKLDLHTDSIFFHLSTDGQTGRVPYVDYCKKNVVIKYGYTDQVSL